MKNPIRISCELWSINRWLQYTGWRVFIQVSTGPTYDTPSRIGLAFYGWKRFDR